MAERGQRCDSCAAAASCSSSRATCCAPASRSAAPSPPASHAAAERNHSAAIGRRPLVTAALLACLLAAVSAHADESPLNSLFLRFLQLPRGHYRRSISSRSSKRLRLDSSYLSPSDYERAAASQSPLPPDDAALSAMSKPELFEGDIRGVAEWDEDDHIKLRQLDALERRVFGRPYNSALNVATYPDKLWPAGRVPYVLEAALGVEQRAAVARAFDEYKNKTCIRFVPRQTSDQHYIYITKNNNFGCSSYVGRAGGRQTVSLEVGKCFTMGIIAHELMHVLGFFHEHSRPDRDAHVDIIEHNVKTGMLRNFEKYPQKIINGLGMPYDYGSVMHYHKLAFSSNGDPTILPKDRAIPIGQRVELSAIDARKVIRLYNCPEPAAAEPIRPIEDDARPRVSVRAIRHECEDLNAHCDMWAGVGHCRWSDKYMRTACKKACGLCQRSDGGGSASTKRGGGGHTVHFKATSKPADLVESGPCYDRNLFCAFWARIGECETESKFMKVFCRHSCGLCR